MRGGLPEDGRERQEHGPLDTVDADKVERAMVYTLERRPRWYKLARLMYLHGVTDLTLCAEFRCGETSLKGYVRALLAWFDAILPPLERSSPLDVGRPGE